MEIVGPKVEKFDVDMHNIATTIKGIYLEREKL